MKFSKEQLEIIAGAININEVKELILDNISEYNQFLIEEIDIDEKDIKYPGKDDTNGCGNLCTI